METIPWPTVGIGSGWALAAMFTALIYYGRLIPKSTHDREMAQADRAVERAEHEANEWRAEGRIKDQGILATLDQVKAICEQNGTTLHDFIAALQKVQGP